MRELWVQLTDKEQTVNSWTNYSQCIYDSRMLICVNFAKFTSPDYELCTSAMLNTCISTEAKINEF